MRILILYESFVDQYFVLLEGIKLKQRKRGLKLNSLPNYKNCETDKGPYCIYCRKAISNLLFSESGI